MTDALDRVFHFTKRLNDAGLNVVVVGGAARDYFLGNTPKDYDIVILEPYWSQAEVLDILRTAANFEPVPMERETISGYECEHESRGLQGVYELKLSMERTPDLDIQVLHFTDQTLIRWDADPQTVVAEHDCSLNHAWFEDVQGRLVPRVGIEFPSPFTGNFNNFRTGWSNATRRAYIEAKFPEFNHR